MAARTKKQQLGYALRFRILKQPSFYGEVAAEAVIDALRDERFSGRCEYYAAAVVSYGPPIYLVALAFRQPGRRNQFDADGWSRFAQRVAMFLASDQPSPTLGLLGSELIDLRLIRSRMSSWLRSLPCSDPNGFGHRAASLLGA